MTEPVHAESRKMSGPLTSQWTDLEREALDVAAVCPGRGREAYAAAALSTADLVLKQ